MTTTDLKKVMTDCTEMINDVVGEGTIFRNIVVKFNKRFTHTLGRCSNSHVGSLIQISEKYYNHPTTTDDDRYSLMFHELMHSVKGCANHGKRFNDLCRQLEEATGVKQIAGSKFKTHSEYNKDTRTKHKYMLECDECGKQYFMKRLRGGKEDGIDYRGRAVHYKCRCEEGAELNVMVLR